MDTGLVAAISCAAVSMVAVVVLALRVALLGRRVAALDARLAQSLDQARGELAQVSAQGLRVVNQQRALERHVQVVSERQGRLELRGEGRPFEQAIAMLRAGASRDDLVSRLGLSDAEAALLVRLHGASAADRAQA